MCAAIAKDGGHEKCNTQARVREHLRALPRLSKGSSIGHAYALLLPLISISTGIRISICISISNAIAIQRLGRVS